MMHIHLYPLDTMFFRDSRPFTAGSEGFAEGGLPSPLTMYGAIGSYYLETIGKSLTDFQNDGDDKLGPYDQEIKAPNSFRIKGPFICCDDDLWFPAPLHCWRLKDLRASPRLLRPAEQGATTRQDQALDLPPLITDETGAIEPYSEYFSRKTLTQLLCGEDPDFMEIEWIERSAPFRTELRTSHQKEKNTGTVADGMLYTTLQLRPMERADYRSRNVASLLTVADRLDVTDFTTVKTACIGGERRPFRIMAEPASDLFPAMEAAFDKIRDQKRFLLYLATPAIFRSGWKPAAIPGATLVGAAIGKPEFISGWLNANIGKKLPGGPRPLLKMVPAGAVYFYKADHWNDADFDAFKETYHFNQSISDYYPNAGFGTTLLGTW